VTGDGELKEKSVQARTRVRHVELERIAQRVDMNEREVAVPEGYEVAAGSEVPFGCDGPVGPVDSEVTRASGGMELHRQVIYAI